MQGELVFKQHGGTRKGAGRPKRKFGSSESHRRREVVLPNTPVHVTMRVGKAIPYLRKRAVWRAIAKATIAAAKTGAMHVVHASVQHNHIHLLVESKDQYAPAKGMHAFQISAAQRINRVAKRKGQVFPDRYNAHVLKTPTEARNAIRYVLTNWRKHGEDRDSPFAIDLFSTGFSFWNERAPSWYEALEIARPSSWLLSEGWRKAGSISPWDAPKSA